MEFLEQSLKYLVGISIILFEFIGLIILIITGIKGAINYVRRTPGVRLELARGMALGLEFKLGGEILRTVVVQELSDLYVVGGIILLRAAITFLIHWEIQGEIPQRESGGEDEKKPIKHK